MYVESLQHIECVCHRGQASVKNSKSKRPSLQEMRTQFTVPVTTLVESQGL